MVFILVCQALFTSNPDNRIKCLLWMTGHVKWIAILSVDHPAGDAGTACTGSVVGCIGEGQHTDNRSRVVGVNENPPHVT